MLPRHPRSSKQVLMTGGRALRLERTLPHITVPNRYFFKLIISQTNVKGTLLAVNAFLPTADSQAAILGLVTGFAPFPAAHLPGISAYTCSKLAQAKVLEFVAAENPNIFSASIHPGLIESEIFFKNSGTPERLPMDKGKRTLPSHFQQ